MSKFEMPFSVNDAQLDQETPGFAEILMTQTGEVRVGDGHTKGGVPLTANYLRDAYVYGTIKDTEVANTSSSMQRIILGTDGQTIQNVESFTQMPCHNLCRPLSGWSFRRSGNIEFPACCWFRSTPGRSGADCGRAFA